MKWVIEIYEEDLEWLKASQKSTLTSLELAILNGISLEELKNKLVQ